MSDDDKGKVIPFPTFVRLEMERGVSDESFRRLAHYVLVGHTPVRSRSLMEWAKAIDERYATQQKLGVDPWRVAETTIGEAYISTVFIAIDHNFFHAGPPILFETMIFGGEHDEYQARCSTWEEAEKMHADTVAMVQKLRVVK
jgi:hypothetical protein